LSQKKFKKNKFSRGIWAPLKTGKGLDYRAAEEERRNIGTVRIGIGIQ
jgi:hypothetical protein